MIIPHQIHTGIYCNGDQVESLDNISYREDTKEFGRPQE